MNPIKFVWRNILARKYLWEYFDEFERKMDGKLKETLALAEGGGGKTRISVFDYIFEKERPDVLSLSGMHVGEKALFIKVSDLLG